MLIFVFFFQAEDGIRDVAVTGVQTCALPIAFSKYTLDLIRKAGFQYDSSAMAMDEPYELLSNGRPTGMVELPVDWIRSEEHTSELQSRLHIVCRLLLERTRHEIVFTLDQSR